MEQQIECNEIGTAWGEQEVELWRDQHDGIMDNAPDWTHGTYCGRLPGNAPMDGSELSAALEAAIDNAAKAVWDAARI